MFKRIRLISLIIVAFLCVGSFSGCSYHQSPESIAEKAFQAIYVDYDASSLAKCIPDDAWKKLVDRNDYNDKNEALLELQDELYEIQKRRLDDTNYNDFTINYEITRVDNYTQSQIEDLDDDLKYYLYSNIEAAAKVYFEYTISVENNNQFIYFDFAIGQSAILPTNTTSNQTYSMIVIKYNGKWYIDPRIIDYKI